MSLDISEIKSLHDFSAALHSAPDDAVLVVKPQGVSGFRRVWNMILGKERKMTREKVVGFLKEAVIEHAQVRESGVDSLVNNVVEQLLSNYQPSSDALLAVRGARQVLGAVSVDIEAWGSAPQVYEQMNLQKGEDTRNVIRWLFGNPEIVGHDFTVITSQLIKAAAFERNETFLKEAQDELLAIGLRLYEQLKGGGLTPSSERLTGILLGQILGLYPFFEPKTGTELILPQKIDVEWELITFRVEQIQLTPKWLGPPILAFGLIPKEESASGVRPRLLFPGTSQPTASWSPLDTWADFVPSYSVGEFVFDWWAKEAIFKWMEQAKHDWGVGVELTGVSLGGSLTLLTVSHRPDLVSVARAFVPPALREEVVADYENKIEEMEVRDHPDVSIYWQAGDIVSLVGPAWSKFWKAVCLIPGEKLNPLESHNKAFAAQPLTAVVRMDAERDSNRLARKIFNIIFEIASIPIFLVLTLVILIRSGVYLIKGALAKERSSVKGEID